MNTAAISETTHSASIRKPFVEQFDKLTKQFQAQLGPRMSELRSDWVNFLEDPNDIDVQVRIHRSVHRLAGSAAIFGFEELGNIAQEAELKFSDLIDSKSRLTDDDVSILTPVMDHLFDTSRMSLRRTPCFPSPVRIGLRSTKFIAVLEKDPMQANTICSYLREAGFKVRLIEAGEELAQKEGTLPHAIVTSLFAEGFDSTALDEIRAAMTSLPSSIPVIVISSRRDIAAKLKAHMRGITAYVEKSSNLGRLVERIDYLLFGKSVDRFRVLAIVSPIALNDDTIELLEKDGVDIIRENRPPFGIKQDPEFSPELIVIEIEDLEDGHEREVISLINDDEDLRKVPLLLLTADKSVATELRRLGIEWDSILEPPLTRKKFASKIAATINANRRSRMSHLADKLVRGSAGCLSTRHPDAERTDQSTDSHAGRSRSEGAKSATVLVVDDDPFIRRALELKLKESGYRVSLAKDADSALTTVVSTPVDLIILDYYLPGGNGDYFLARLRDNAQTRSLPVVFVTQHRVGKRKDLALEREVCGKYGSLAFIQKPFDMNEIIAVVEQHAPFQAAAAEDTPIRTAAGAAAG